MSIDEKATIGSIVEALAQGTKSADIAKQMPGIGERRLRDALKEAGFVFSNKAPKGWHYVGQGEPPLDKSIFDYVNKGNTEFTRSNTKVEKGSREVHEQFTQDEVQMIREMLKQWQGQGTATTEQGIHDRIRELSKGEKTRKTIVIDKGIGERLDKFCEAERVNKSDVLHLALIDFLNKVEKDRG